MGLDIRLIRLHQLWRILDHQQILGVLLLSRLGEVEGARDDRGAVDDDHLVMGDRVLVIDERLDAGVDQEGRRAVLVVSLDLSSTARTLTPRLWASINALAIGAEVKLYACTRICWVAA